MHIRNNKSKLWSRATPIIFLIMLLIAFLPAQSAQAIKANIQETLSATYTLEDFNYTTDQEFLGVLVERAFNIAFPSNWIIESDSILTIHFSHSNALNPVSSMSVDWNDQRVGSTLLTQENTQNGTLQIMLSPEVIQPGYNILKIKFFMGISEDFCIDFDNPAVWAVVHKNTSLQLSYKQAAPEPELGSAPDILIDSSLISPNEITIVIPDDPDLQTLNALAVMTTKLGQLANWRNLTLNVMTLSEAVQTSPLGNLVVIATIDQIKIFDPNLSTTITSALANYTDSAERPPISQEDGLITFQRSSFDPTAYVLSLTGTTTTAIEKCARAAALDALFDQSEGQWVIVRTVPDPSDHPASNKLTVSLEDLGLDNTTAYGTSEQTIQFNFPLSALWDIDSEAWLALHFSHSELLNADRSTLNVMINNIPVTSIELSSKTADNTQKDVRIPLRFLSIGNNTITIKANMKYSESRDQTRQFCTDDTYPRAWLTVHSDTTLILPEIPEETSLNLINFPYGFADPFSFEDFVFVLSEGNEKESAETLAELALTIGKSLKGSPGEISVAYSGDNHSQDEAVNYVISIGTIPALLTESINNTLPVPLDLSTGLPQTNDTVLKVDTETGIRSYIQSFKKNNKINIIITAMKQDGLLAAGKLLSDPNSRSGLDGSVAVVADAENASVYQIEPDVSDDQISKSDDQILGLNVSGQSIWIVRISIGVAVISIIALIIALVWKNKQTRET